jgi:hypothetical protein
MRLVCCLLIAVLVSSSASFRAQENTSRSKIYHEGWIDLNKNGRMDVYENRGHRLNDGSKTYSRK